MRKLGSFRSTWQPCELHFETMADPPAASAAKGWRVNHTLKIRILMSSKRYFGDMTGVTCTRQEHDGVLMFEKLNYCDTLA